MTRNKRNIAIILISLSIIIVVIGFIGYSIIMISFNIDKRVAKAERIDNLYEIAYSVMTDEQKQELERIKSETTDWGGYGTKEELEKQKSKWKEKELDIIDQQILTEEQKEKIKELVNKGDQQ